MLASKYADQGPATPEEPQTPQKSSLDEKPLPALPPQSSENKENAQLHSRAASNASNNAASQHSRLRRSLDAGAAVFTPASFSPVALGRRSNHASRDRIDWSEDDPKSPYKPSGFTPQRPPVRNIPLGPSSMNGSPTKPNPAANNRIFSRGLDLQTVLKTQDAKLAVPAEPDLKSPTPDIVSRLDTVTPAPLKGKKIMSKKGKPCIIRVPKNITYARPDYMPLTHDEITSRIAEFEKDGWDTRGYSHWRFQGGEDDAYGHSQGRAVFPDPTEAATEQKHQSEQKSFAITFPDRRKWDKYVDDLMEAKLRALGVSNTPPPEEPPVPTPMEQPRQASPFAGFAASPPDPTASAMSQQPWMSFGQSPFSPGESTQNTSMGALASPALSLSQQINPQRPGNLSRSSTFGQQNYHGFNFNMNQQFPGWNPQAMYGAQPDARGASPALTAGLNRMNSQFSFGTPDLYRDIHNASTPKAMHEGPTPPSSKMSRSDTLLSQQQYKPATPAQDDDVEMLDADTPLQVQQDSYPGLAYPTPRGRNHRHNISESLEKEVENPQYYPGEYVDERKLGNMNFAFNGPVNDKASHGPGRSVGHRSLLSAASNSSSRFNAEAKEFKFNPSLPQKADNNASFGKSVFGAPQGQANDASNSVTSFNASASTFKPPQQGDFNFSSKSISFDADRFRQAQADKAETKNPDAAKPEETTAKPKIFSHIDASDIVKPSKKSKAIPIINPNAASFTPAKPKAEAKPDEEDSEGRIIGPDSSRSKRGRFNQEDGDTVPQFATPTDAAPQDLPAAPILPSQMGQPLPVFDDALSKSTADTEKLTEKLVDLSDDSWHGGDIKRAAIAAAAKPETETIKEEPKKEEVKKEQVNTEPSKFTQPWRKTNSPAAKLEDAPQEVKEEEAKDAVGKEEKLVKGAYVPPHKRGSVSQAAEQEITAPTASKDSEELKEIDDVMGQLNDGNSDFGVEEGPTSRGRSPLKPLVPLEASKHAALADAPQASKAAPAEKPTLPQETQAAEPEVPKQLDQLAKQTLEPNRGIDADWIRDQQKRASESPVRKLGGIQASQVSDWDDMVPSSEEFVPQAQFFDTRVKGLIENAIKKQLDPITRSMKDMRASVTRIHQDNDVRAMSGHEKSSSDADDEDDIEEPVGPPTRQASRKSDRKLDLMRLIVTEAVRNNVPVASGSTEALEREIALRHEAERKAEEAERRLDEVQRVSQLSEKEIMLYKENAENNEHKIRSLEDVRKMSDERVNELTAEVDAMQETLDEYRSSSKKWRQEIDNAKSAREILSGTIEKMRREVEDNQRATRDSNDIADQMRTALGDTTANLARERSLWQNKFDDNNKEIATLTVKLDEVQRSRTHLEEEVERLALQEKIAIKSSVSLEEAHNRNSQLETEIEKLRAEILEQRETTLRLERDAADAQDDARSEAQRQKVQLETDLELAYRRVDTARAEYETRIEILNSQVTTANDQAASTKQHYESMLAQSEAMRSQALEEAGKLAEARLKEQQALFERQLGELAAQQQRDIKNNLEDKHRSETHLSNSLKLADEELALQQDKIKHLEDKVQVAQAAAQAAATAAASAAKSKPVPVPTPAVAQPVATPVTAPALPSATERVSPQALRESIAVLQEQLQEREGRIEELEAELGSIDKDAPAKLQRAETEINWLREVLQVRVDDLNDLVANLQLERFDRGAARNAAIRIRANLQMEQQEKERALRGEPRNGPLPSLQDLQNFATPRAAQISAAWNSWRKGGQSPVSSVRQALAPPSQETPSKRPSFTGQRDFANEGAASAQNFLSTLMTPPPSTLRRTPSTASTQRPLQSTVAPPQLSKEIGGASEQDHGVSSPTRSGSHSAYNAPATPPLLAKDHYDQDADESRNFSYPTSESGDDHEKAIIDEPSPTLNASKPSIESAQVHPIVQASEVHPIVEETEIHPIVPASKADSISLPSVHQDDELVEDAYLPHTTAGVGEVEPIVEDTTIQPLGEELAQAGED